MNERDIEVIDALKVIYGENFAELDAENAKSTVFEIIDNLGFESDEPALPWDRLSEAGQIELMRQLLLRLSPN